ncbi:MAG: hypothetical protein WDO15_10185 [Bacteroidota bacterium]
MKTLFIITLLLITTEIFAQSQSDIDFFEGKWEITVKGTQNGDATVILVLDKGGDGLIGSVQDANGAELSKIARVIVGTNKLNLQFVVQGQGVNVELVKKDDDHVTVRYGNYSAEGQRKF